MSDTPIIRILEEIEKTTSYRFFYSDNVREQLNTLSSISASASTINSAMRVVLAPTGLAFEVQGNQVSIIQQRRQNNAISITGNVKNETGNVLPGVTVYLKSNTLTGTTTDAQGNFSMNVPPGAQTLVFSYIGMETLEVNIEPGRTSYAVIMKNSSTSIEEVVVQTGIFERDKVSFTGSSNTVTGTELRMVGNQNIVQSLKTLDPSFVVLDNLEMGSDPNTMSKIEVRGHGSASINAITDAFSTDPNQPLFVLDGVEVTLQRIVDLDINRVASITILKDAGSTALYGSRGANGVVVVETVKPVPGEVRVYYTGSVSVQAPDLTVFNMMNSREKLEFERLSGKYTNSKSGSYGDYYHQLELDALYSKFLEDVLRGVDTYWLSEPVRTGVTHAHSVRVSVGHEELLIDAGAQYKNEQGVMKGSNRETWDGNINAVFRTSKLNITNYLSISGFDGNNSPYGSFSTWVNTSPYFTKYNENGELDMFLQRKVGIYSPIETNIANPLYNAKLNSKNNQNQVMINNNFQIQYSISDNFRIKGGLNLTRTHQRNNTFSPPENTAYYDKPQNEKGQYTNREIKQVAFRANIDASYAEVFADVHSLTLNARAQLRQSVNDYTGFTAVGFPYNSKGTPNLAHSYKEESRPDFYYNKYREVNFIGSFNYNYALRYLFDFSMSVDGSTTFGANRLLKNFWSMGIGWNINKEKFAEGWHDINVFKLRAVTGTSGNQNIGTVTSSAIYSNFVESNRFGIGYYLTNVGNPDLPWQVSRDFGVGLDFSAMQGKYSLTFDFYYKKTKPNVVFVPQAPSTGTSHYALPMGWMENKGFEFIASYSPIYNQSDRIFLTLRLTGAYNKGKIGGLNTLLEGLNEEQITTASMRQYRNGYSPTAIWAVRSKGIDPATGEEVYIKSNGDITYEYDYRDMVAVGDERPDIMGVISLNFRYKNFFLNTSFRYSVGSELYNTALYTKVENITKSQLQNNQDKRALYDRWQYPGHKASFRAISIVEDISNQTSRFVQKNNYLTGESISVGYELINNRWVKNNLGMRSLTFTAYVNDIFRLQTSKIERGYNYPFARFVSLGISASF